MADTFLTHFSKLTSLLRHTELDEESRWMKSLKFIEILGQGSFGVVLKANDTADSSTSAVKFIFPEYSSDQDQDTKDTKLKKKKQLSREVDNVVDKRHENVISTLRFAIRSFSHTDIQGIFKGMVLTDKLAGFVSTYTNKAKRLNGIECICIQMELCGNTLRSWLDLNKDKTVDLPLAEFQLGIVRGLIEGLTYLHKYKIVHRDFKPENIYFSQGYLLPVKIGDFGLSRELHNENSKSALTSNVGTLDYMAPETHTKDYSLQADLYSLGLVMWEVLQLISKRDRRSLFDKLVVDKEESLIREHPLVGNCRELIVHLTRRKIDERTKSIEDVRLRVRYPALNTTTKSCVSGSDTATKLIGREAELKKLKVKFKFETTARKIILISGNIGIGKTFLIQHFLEELPLKILWLDCFSFTCFTQRKRKKSKESKFTSTKIFQECMPDCIILDKVDFEDKEHSQMGNWCYKFVSDKSSVSLIILTGELNSNYGFEPDLHLALEAFSLDETRQFLSEFGKSAVSQLQEMSGGNPLVLSEMKKAIVNKFNSDPNRFITTYRSIKMKKVSLPSTPSPGEIVKALFQILAYFDTDYKTDKIFLLHVLKVYLQSDKLTFDHLKIGFESPKGFFKCEKHEVEILPDGQSRIRCELGRTSLNIAMIVKNIVEACLTFYNEKDRSENWLKHTVSVWNYFCSHKDEYLNVSNTLKVLGQTLRESDIGFVVTSPHFHVLLDEKRLKLKGLQLSPPTLHSSTFSKEASEANFGDKAHLETEYEFPSTSGLLKRFGNLGMTVGLSENIASEVKDDSQINDRTNWLDSLSFTEVLGKGAFGIVLKAIDKSNGEMSAIKIIFPEYSNDPNEKTHERQSILREAKIMINKVNPNIVATFNFAEKSLGPEDIDKIFEEVEAYEETNRWMRYKLTAQRLGSVDTIFIQMEICGKTLRHWLKLNMTSAIDPGLAEFQVEIVKGLIEGVSFLHKNKIIHRDIKPENVYFSQDNMLPVKIGDFGLSRHLYQENKDDIPYRALTFYRDDGEYSLTSKVGSPYYRAPEVYSKNYSFQADLYSLGLVMWEVLQLIRNTDRRTLFDRLVHERDVSLIENHLLITNCREIIKKLTSRNVESRTKSIEEVSEAIDVGLVGKHDRHPIRYGFDSGQSTKQMKPKIWQTQQSDGPVAKSDWIDSMRFDTLLGSGSFGFTFKVIDKSDYTSSAVKIMFNYDSPNDQTSWIEFRKQLYTEISILSDKRHPNIVHTIRSGEMLFSLNDLEGMFKQFELAERDHSRVDLYRYFAQKHNGKALCIQMELCGHSLRSWLNIEKKKDESMDEFQVGIVTGLVKGLKFLHQNKILHRDINPENILFSQDYSLPVKLGGFGLSRQLHSDNSFISSLTSNGDITLDYRAPEAHTNDFSFQTDLYSLGLVMWEVLQLISERDRRRMFDILVNDKDHSLVKDHPLISNGREIIIKLTQRKAKERLQSIEDLEFKIIQYPLWL